jgi:hypothetical protein
MPRMPPLGTRFREAVDDAVALSSVAEAIRDTPSYRYIRSQLTITRVERLYEMSYLRMFAAWEAFIEDSLLHMLCGFDSVIYTPAFAPPHRRFVDLASARRHLFGTRTYLLWYDPATIQARCSRYLTTAPVEVVVSSNAARLEWFAFIRNRIAHDAEDARNKFDVAAINLAGRRFPRSRPGKFLRSPDPTSPGLFLNSIATEFKSLALQIAL